MSDHENRYTEPGPGPGARRKIVIAVSVAVAAVAVVLVLLFVLGDGFGAGGATASAAPRTTYGNVVVQGVNLNGMTKEDAKTAVTEAVRQQDAQRRYTLRQGEKQAELPGSALQITYDVDAVLEKAWSAAEPAPSRPAQQEKGGLFGWFGKKEEAPSAVSSAPPQEFPLTPTVDAGALKSTLGELTKDMNAAAVEPTVASFDAATGTFQFKDGQKGRQVDLDALAASVQKLVQAGPSGAADVPVKELDYRHSVADLQKNIRKLGHFTTESTNTENGTYNMRRALETVNGTVVAPGATFSFLGVVGSADGDAGYKLAGALENGISTQAYGGGICQASTTIYGAVLRSNGEIVERSPHSVPSTYVKIGQDAAVSYPGLDFKFKNPTEYPMYIQSGADGRTMYCTVYGYKDGSWDTIEVTSQKTESIAQPADQTKDDSSKPKGTRELQAKGRAGARATAQRVFYKGGQAVRTEDLFSSYYPPKANVYLVGTGAGKDTKPAQQPQTPSQQAPASKPASKPAPEPASSAQPEPQPPSEPAASSAPPEEETGSQAA